MGARADATVPALVIAATDIDESVRASAMSALKVVDPTWAARADAAKVIPSLVSALKSRSSEIVSATSQLLRQIGPEAVPQLLQMISEPDDSRKVFAIRIVGHNGPKASDAAACLGGALACIFDSRVGWSRAAKPVAQTSGLPCRRFPIGRVFPAQRASAGCKPAIRQTGGLRHAFGTADAYEISGLAIPSIQSSGDSATSGLTITLDGVQSSPRG